MCFVGSKPNHLFHFYDDCSSHGILYFIVLEVKVYHMRKMYVLSRLISISSSRSNVTWIWTRMKMKQVFVLCFSPFLGKHIQQSFFSSLWVIYALRERKLHPFVHLHVDSFFLSFFSSLFESNVHVWVDL